MAKHKYTMKISWKILPVLAVAIASTITGCNEFQSRKPQKIGETLTSASPIKPSPKIQLLHTIPGHLRFSVTSVAISPDGQILVSGSNDNTIKIWNLRTFKLLRILKHSRGVNSIAISRDGQTLASGSDDKTIKIWNLLTGKLLRTLNGHSDLVASVAFSPNGQILASGSSDRTIKLWNYRTGKLLHTRAHPIGVSSVAFNPDGQTFASGGYDNTIKLWNLHTGKLLRTVTAHLEPISSVAFSPDGQILVSSSEDKTIKLWNLRSGELLRTLSGESGWFNYDFDPNITPVYAIAFSPDGQILASSSVKNDIKIWNFRTGELLRTLIQHSDVVHSIAFSPDGQIFASGSQDGTIKIWSVSTKPVKFLWFN